MGTGAEIWVPALIAAVGSGATAYQTREVAKDQDVAAAAGIRAQAAKQREVDAQVNREIGALEGSTPEEEQAAAQARFMQQLRSARGNVQGTNIPGASSRYGAGAEQAQAAIQNYGEQRADAMARIRGALEQRQNEAIGFNRTGSTVADLAREAAGADFLNRLRTGSIRANPWVGAGSDLALAIAGGMADRAGSGTPTGTATLPKTGSGVPQMSLYARGSRFAR